MNPIELVNNLRDKGIIVTEYENIGEQYREQWIHKFSDSEHGQKSDLQEFLWYLFSDEKLNFLKDKQASAAFNKVNKQYCFIFFQESDDVLKVEYASLMSAGDFRYVTGEYCDVYVVDKGFNWTYVVPHEEDWGPHFYRK